MSADYAGTVGVIVFLIPVYLVFLCLQIMPVHWLLCRVFNTDICGVFVPADCAGTLVRRCR